MKGSIVKVYDYVYNEDKHRVEKCLKGKGILHEFSIDHEEYETGPGSFPCAIIEWTSGQLESVHVNCIRFVKE